MKAKMTDAQKIARIAARHEEDGWESYARYSGRCMFGDVCPGIACPGQDVQAVKSAVRKAGIREAASVDNMGLDMIVYWSGIRSDPEPARDYAAERTAIGDDPDELFDEAEAEGGIFGRNE